MSLSPGEAGLLAGLISSLLLAAATSAALLAVVKTSQGTISVRRAVAAFYCRRGAASAAVFPLGAAVARAAAAGGTNTTPRKVSVGSAPPSSGGSVATPAVEPGTPGRTSSATSAAPTPTPDAAGSAVVTPAAYDWEIDPRKLKLRLLIGKGNFGEVWLATWMGTPVAVKTIVPELQSKDKLVKRFLEETLLMASLHHPNVVVFMGACITQPNMCIMMEYCQHGSLHHFLKREEEHGIPITLGLIYRFALDVARGIHYLHKRSTVQRDLKARNILVDENLNAKVADFGLSRTLADDLEGKLTACGTPAWTAPEVVKGARYTEKIDVYSFGILMWELIARQEPYGGQKGVQIAYAAAEQGLRPEVPEYTPPEYKALMEECWAADPDARPSFQTILRRLFQLKKSAEDLANVTLPPLRRYSGATTASGAHVAAPLSGGGATPSRSRRTSAETGGGGGGGAASRGPSPLPVNTAVPPAVVVAPPAGGPLPTILEVTDEASTSATTTARSEAPRAPEVLPEVLPGVL